MSSLRVFVLIMLAVIFTGCGGSNDTIIPTDKLTDEQNAAVKAEDEAIEDEEGASSRK